jgi:hypothetical protein
LDRSNHLLTIGVAAACCITTVGCGNRTPQNSTLRPVDTTSITLNSAPHPIATTSATTQDPSFTSGPDTTYDTDSDGPVASDYDAEELARSKADLLTDLTGTVGESTITATIRISVAPKSNIVSGPHTIVTVEGGTILEPLNPQCKRIALNNVDCDYGEAGETVNPVVETIDPIILSIDPSGTTTTIAATSRYTEPFNDIDMSNNTKTLTLTNQRRH